jgi:mycothiol synthase
MIRPPRLDDLEAVVDLMNCVTRTDSGRNVYGLETVGRYWQQSDFDLETDAQLVLAAKDQLVGFAQFMREAPPPAPFEVDSWVHPDFVDQGVGEYLLSWIDQRAAQAARTLPADGPIQLDHVFVYPQNRSAVQRLEQNGYQLVRQFNRMQIDLTAPPPAPKLLDGISIRSMRPGEEYDVYEKSEEAQADEWGHERLSFDKWKYYFIDATENFDPTLYFLAVEGDEIVGHALCRWERPGEPEVGVVRELGVRRKWRRRGIALALLHTAFGEFYRRGKRSVGLGVDATSYTGADRLYEKAGMYVFQASLNYQKILRR